MYTIISTHGHYEVLCNGKFFCSADSYHEAENEIEKETHT